MGPRDPSGSGRPSVFDRLYSQGSRPAGAAASDPHDRPGREPEHDLHRSGSTAADDPSRSLGRRLSSRISSAVVAPAGTGREQQDHEDGDNEQTEAAAGGRKRLLSAVMVNGQARQLSGSLEGRGAAAAAAAAEERPTKRPTLNADARTKQRAARMFGTLLVGTLQKFQ